MDEDLALLTRDELIAEVRKLRAGIRDQRALRDWDTAEFYARTQHYGGAKYYYAKIVKDFPETKLAQESRVKAEQMNVKVEEYRKKAAGFGGLFSSGGLRS